MLPERFDLTYVDESGEHVRPVAIHRAIYGSLERFIGVLVEHTGGRLAVLVRAGPGGRRPHRRPARRGGPRAGGRAAREGHPRRGRRLLQPDAEQDPPRPGAEGALHARARAIARSRPARPRRARGPGSSRSRSAGRTWPTGSPRRRRLGAYPEAGAKERASPVRPDAPSGGTAMDRTKAGWQGRGPRSRWPSRDWRLLPAAGAVALTALTAMMALSVAAQAAEPSPDASAAPSARRARPAIASPSPVGVERPGHPRGGRGWSTRTTFDSAADWIDLGKDENGRTAAGGRRAFYMSIKGHGRQLPRLVRAGRASPGPARGGARGHRRARRHGRWRGLRLRPWRSALVHRRGQQRRRVVLRPPDRRAASQLVDRGLLMLPIASVRRQRCGWPSNAPWHRTMAATTWPSAWTGGR